VRKRYKATTDSDHDQPIAANLLRQTFTAEGPNQRWVGDTTECVIEREQQTVPRGHPRSVFAVCRTGQPRNTFDACVNYPELVLFHGKYDLCWMLVACLVP